VLIPIISAISTVTTITAKKIANDKPNNDSSEQDAKENCGAHYLTSFFPASLARFKARVAAR